MLRRWRSPAHVWGLRQWCRWVAPACSVLSKQLNYKECKGLMIDLKF